MFACRMCRVPLSAASGCAVCNSMRQNLVVVGETEDESPSLPSVGGEAMTIMRDQIRHHKGVLKTNPGNGEYQAKFLACVNSLAKLTGEVRKLQDDGYKAIEAMSFTERAKLFVEWYAGLPSAYRTGLTEQMAEHERALSAPVPAAAAGPTPQLPEGDPS